MTGAQLRKIRQRLGLSQKAMAEALGVRGGKTTIYRWETGRYPVPETVARLAMLLDRHNPGRDER